MYCQSCGQSHNQKQKYCTSCGSQMMVSSDDIDKEGMPGKMLDNVLTTVFLTVLFGLGILIGLVAVLLGNNVEPKFVMFISMAYLAAIFGICATLLKQVPKLIDARLNNYKSNDLKVQPLLQERTTAQLEEPQIPVASVTDRTTRILERVPNER